MLRILLHVILPEFDPVLVLHFLGAEPRELEQFKERSENMPLALAKGYCGTVCIDGDGIACGDGGTCDCVHEMGELEVVG